MPKSKHYKKEKKFRIECQHIFKVSVIVFCALVVVPMVIFGVYSVANSNVVYANQYIGDISLAKMSKDELKQLVSDRTAELVGGDLELRYEGGDRTFKFLPKEAGLHYDIDATVLNIWSVGHNEKVLTSFWQQLRSLFAQTHHNVVYTVNEEALNAKVAAVAKEIDAPEKDYELNYENGTFTLKKERSAGKRIDQETIAKDLRGRFAVINNDPITFSSHIYEPRISEERARIRLQEANAIVGGGSLKLVYGNQNSEIDRDTIGGMIKSKANGNDMELYFDDSRINKHLDSVASLFNVEPANAKLKIVGGKASVFQLSQEGRTVNVAESREKVKEALLKRINGEEVLEVAIVVKLTPPEIGEDDISNLGITELVGTGQTTFTGSPTNRVHNIQTGAAALNGILIKPGETLSILDRLGEIDDKAGYLPELVIKEDRTIPEFGGGLCQVSTTLFRAALNSGMEILERSNHKYRVSYYEPPIGMDATIYDPAPDFKFKNNYSSHILIQSVVEGYRIRFDFYGTKDGRTVEIGNSETWDVTDPGPRVNIETDTLQPGEEKQIEKAHQGISAKFHYKISREGQVLQERDFYSKYVPWPEKWLVGKQPEQPTEEQPSEEQQSEEQPAG